MPSEARLQPSSSFETANKGPVPKLEEMAIRFLQIENRRTVDETADARRVLLYAWVRQEHIKFAIIDRVCARLCVGEMAFVEPILAS
ncbi:MAG TPA: hypothetical protein VM345_02505 [Acidimicrobiales bacterium]|nr:hypothetical protein [Acidimicrobiales bacterium]